MAGRLRHQGAARRKSRGGERVIGFGDVFGRDAGGLIVLLVLFGALTLASDEFLTGNNLSNLARQVAIFGIIAIGAAAGDPHRGHRPVGRLGAGPVGRDRGGAAGPRARRSRSAILAGLARRPSLAGVCNGVLVATPKLPPFIVTLGMLGIARGVVLVSPTRRTVQPLPRPFGEIANGDAARRRRTCCGSSS